MGSIVAHLTQYQTLFIVKRSSFKAKFPEMAALMPLCLHNYDITLGRQGEGHEISNHIVG